MQTHHDNDVMREIYRKTGSEGKNVLESIFGKDAFAPITERVTTFEEACYILGRKSSEVQEKDKIEIIIEALRDGKELDWGNPKQKKYQCYFNMGGTEGSGFSLNVVCCDCAYSVVSSRLCFLDENTARYAAAKFLHLFKAHFLTPA